MWLIQNSQGVDREQQKHAVCGEKCGEGRREEGRDIKREREREKFPG